MTVVARIDVYSRPPAVEGSDANGDLDDYMNYYKTRYRDEIHLSRYAPGSITDLGLTA